MPSLADPQHEAFALAYAGHRNATKAAIEAGFPAVMAQDLLHGNTAVAGRVRELWGQAMANAGVTAERVIQEIARVAFQSARDLYTPEGDLVPVHEMTDDVAATITGLEVETRYVKDADGEAVPITTRKYKRAGKMEALTLLAKHFKVVGDEGDGMNALASALSDSLKAGRQRAYEAARASAEDAVVRQPGQPGGPLTTSAHYVPAGEDPATGERKALAQPDFVPARVYDSSELSPAARARAYAPPVVDSSAVKRVQSHWEANAPRPIDAKDISDEDLAN